MGELPSFLTGIPEDSISKQEVSNEPTRIFQAFSASLILTNGTVNLPNIPDNHALEISSITLAVVNSSTPVNITGSLDVYEGGVLKYTPMIVILDHKEHANQTVAYPPLTLLIGSGQSMKFRIEDPSFSADTGYLVVTGYLLKKDELGSKKNIFL